MALRPAAETLEALHVGAFRELLAREARTAPGRRSCLDLAPLPDPESARSRLARTAAWGLSVERDGRGVPASLPDPDPSRRRLAAEGVVLEATEIRALARSLAAADALGRRLRALDREAFGELAADAAAFPAWPDWVVALPDRIESDGALADDASPELARIRRERVKQAERLRRRLESLMRSFEKTGELQEAFVTERAGRFVLPVRASAARERRGIVHAASSTGATLFVEPLEAVEANNERIALAEREAAEVERILRDWSERLRALASDVDASLRGLARFDRLEAIHAWSAAAGAAAPELADGGDLWLDGVRHPLLLERGVDVVPLDLRWPEDRPVLVVSGPNAGGKTVVLKSLGLAVWSAHAGVPIPSRAARIPWMRQLRADIGDPQSLAADLSTFSGHMRAVAESLHEIEPPGLFLFDELGSGTEPDEGAALARACLERFSRYPGARVAISTHHGALKAWAAGADSVLGAAMEFDDVDLGPTYRLLPGETGVSAGFSIARRMGVPRDVVEAAEAGLDDTRREIRRTLERLRARERERREQLAALARERERTEAELARRREEAAAERERTREEFRRTMERELRAFRKRGRELLSGLEGAKARDRFARKAAHAETSLAARIAAAGRGAETPRAGRPLTETPRVGDRVWVPGLSREATVDSVDGARAVVRSGAFTMTVDWASLHPAPGATGGDVRERTPARRSGGTPDEGDAASRLVAPASELKLIGERVEPALERLDRALDRAVLEGRSALRIVHGHGTGRLKRAVREFLRDHAGVASFRPGDEREGGDGATIAVLE